MQIAFGFQINLTKTSIIIYLVDGFKNTNVNKRF